jgi:hypothetical protein
MGLKYLRAFEVSIRRGPNSNGKTGLECPLYMITCIKVYVFKGSIRDALTPVKKRCSYN